jgi:bifunctional DNase/RNase
MVVLGELEEPHRRLRIVIAQPEARAIQGAWTGVIPVRPSTWDLFVSAVALLEGRIDRVVITSVQEERHFFASLELERDGERRALSCRPSDGIAVALRAYGAEIYAARQVVDAVGLGPDGTRYGPYVKPEPPVVDLPVGEPPVGEPPVGEAPVGEAPVGEPPVGEPPVAEPPVVEPAAPVPPGGRTRAGRLPRKAPPRKAGAPRRRRPPPGP